MDPLNQEKAVEFIKQAAAKKTYSNIEKAELFNLKMLDWAEKSGSHLSDCMLNCLREMALASLKASSAKLDDGQAWSGGRAEIRTRVLLSLSCTLFTCLCSA